MKQNLSTEPREVYKDRKGRWEICIEEGPFKNSHYYRLCIHDLNASGTKKFFGRDCKTVELCMSKGKIDLGRKIDYYLNLIQIDMPQGKVAINYQI